MNPEEHLTVGFVDDVHTTDTPQGRAVRRIIEGLKEFGIRVGDVASPEDARAAFTALPEVDCILINWNLGGDSPQKRRDTETLIREIRARNDTIPVFLMGEPGREAPLALSLEMVREVNEYIWVMEDTPEFIAGRITAAAKRYREKLLPPFFGELVRFSRDFE